MSIINAASDAFSNPDSPLYYVVGVVFLLLIFGALAIYIVVSGKKKKKAQAQADENAENQKAQEKADEQAEVTPTEETAQSEGSDPAEQEAPAEELEKEAETEKAPENTEETPDEAEEKAQEQPVEEAEQPTVLKRKPPQKPFIDRLIAAKNVHLTYNALKNAILSYPGIKASLSKKEELFYFGQDKKASIDVTADAVELKLYVDPATLPDGFTVDKVSGDLPTAMSVTEDKVAEAEKLITFAMNVALLTKNEKRRYIDYVQNAINAKNRAKKK